MHQHQPIVNLTIADTYNITLIYLKAVICEKKSKGREASSIATSCILAVILWLAEPANRACTVLRSLDFVGNVKKH